jgi:polyhydroxyalkanoate synthesis regulator phasin
MQLIIDELKRHIENEKENMGAAGKRRENELLGMLEELRREMKLKIEQISKLEASEKQLQLAVKERDETIERLRGEIADLTAQNKRLEDELFRA